MFSLLKLLFFDSDDGSGSGDSKVIFPKYSSEDILKYSKEQRLGSNSRPFE